jgi:FixJ family two-component response regulator
LLINEAKQQRLESLNWLSSDFTGTSALSRKRSPILGTRPLVIVVDDDPSILRAVQRVLQVHGYDTEVYDDVEGFLKRAHLKAATCLVLDIQLQHTSGIELRRQLTHSGHSVPVIFITAVESEVRHKSALEAGCVAYLQKPFPSNLLIEAVETAIRKHSAR